MPLYTYKAVDKDGRPRAGEIRAENRAEAASLLSRDGLLPILLEEKGRAVSRMGGLGRSLRVLTPFQKVSALDKILLTRHLAAILRAGIGLVEALDILLADAKKPALQKILQEAKSGVERGEPLSSIFANYPQYFSPVFVGLVKAGEVSGTMESALDNLSGQLERDYNLLKQVRMAMVYPLILLIGSAGIIVLLMTFVLPRMAKAFRGVIGELPLITQFFIGLSGYLSRWPLLTIALFLALLAAGFYFTRSAWGKHLLFRWFERLAVVGELMQKLALARFSRTFKNLLSSGVPAIEAIETAATTIGNPTYTVSLMAITDELRRGSNLSAAFKARPELFPSMFASIVLVGERTGTLERSLETLAAFYEEEVDRVLKTLVSLLEPALIFVMGIVVALVALSVLLPIFRVVRTFQQV